MPFREPGLSAFEPKDPDELEKQIDSLENEHALNLVPPGENREGFLQMSLAELKERYPVRFATYLSLLRNKRHQENTGEDNISDAEIGEMRKWINALNSLDNYIQDHEAGNETTLYERQFTVFDDLRNFVEEGGREGYVKLPTGVGKTVLFTEFVEALNLKTVIVVPTRLLVDQTGRKIEQFAPDLDVGKIYADAQQHNRQVTIITYNSLINKIRSGELDPEDCDCLILDEAHTALSEQRVKAVQQFTNALKIGFTATPEYSKDKHVNHLLPNEIHHMEIAEAVKDGLMSSFSSIIARTSVDISKVPVSSNGEYSQEELGEAINIASRNQGAVDLYKNNFEGQLGVVYCSGIKHAETVARQFTEGGISGAAINGDMSRKEQENILTRFHDGEVKILVNADLLIAGFDEQRASVCINLRPTRSRVVAEQRGGRVLRLNPGDPTKHAYIIDFLDGDFKDLKSPPVVFGDVADVVEAEPDRGFPRLQSDFPEEKQFVAGRKEKLILDIPGLEVVVQTEEVKRIIQELRVLEPKEKIFMDLDELQEKVREAGIRSKEHYQQIYKHNVGWPANPREFFKDRWKGWGHFLGTEERNKGPLSFEQLQEEVRVAGIASWKQYQDVRKEHVGWPLEPIDIYREQWRGWSEFVGRKLPYEELRKDITAAGITSVSGYKSAYKDHPTWPAAPDVFYKEQWKGWNSFLSTEAKDYSASFEDFRQSVRNAGIKNVIQYKEVYKTHQNWPSNPELVYTHQWESWPSFLGTEKEWPSFEMLREEVRESRINSRKEYGEVYKDHSNWPANPQRVYADKWKGWGDFLGK